MRSVRLVNVRSLVDSGAVQLAPITVLVGQNSSGKSTFVRFLPLLRQTAEVFTREPLLWFGRLVDFGSAEVAASRLAGAGAVGFDASFEMDGTLISNSRSAFSIRSVDDRRAIQVTVSVRYQSVVGEAKKYEWKLSFLEHEIALDVSDTAVTKILINGGDYTDLTKGQLEVRNWSSCFPNLVYREAGPQDVDPFTRQIATFVRGNSHGKSQNERIVSVVRNLVQVPLDTMLQAVRKPYGADSMWAKRTSAWSTGSAQFRRLRDLILGARLAELTQLAGNAFGKHCTNVRYITPIRASAERYYRRQGLALGEIDSQGQNVAMFLDNLSRRDKESFTHWMAEHFGFAVDTIATSGHISMVIRDAADQNGVSVNLADTGFGFSQVIPVLMQIWSVMSAPKRVTRRMVGAAHIVAIEQPELHLHPRLQAALADVLWQAVVLARDSGINLRLLLETHSEQIINRFGRRISEQRLPREDVSIVMFDKPSLSSATTVKVAEFDDDGFIIDWPYGFFETRD